MFLITLYFQHQIIAGDPQTDPTVKKHLMGTLKGFHQQFKDDRSMKVYATWWDDVGGARGVSSHIEAAFTATTRLCRVLLADDY